MLFAIRFTDKADSREIRQLHLDAHLTWLDQRRQSILVAGSLRETPDSSPVGGLWVVEAESKEAARELFQTDPFWIHGMRECVEILHWSKAFPDERRLV